MSVDGIWSLPIGDVLFGFAFFYPLFMAYLWMIGGIYYYLHWERRQGRPDGPPPALSEYPPVSILVPCYNEAANLHDTMAGLMELEYPDFEVIAINDGSADETGERLDELATRYPKLRVLHLAQNQGKAMALRMGSLASEHEFLMCVDGDATLDRHALSWTMMHFVNGPRVGAVTGNPRIRTRSTLLGRIQVGEFSSIIGLIKRAQRIYGRVFTVSGVMTCFRKSALHRVGYWSLDMVTEDIDISWRLQLEHFDIRYEPNALCWILMPETFRGLWSQRLRWAQGGAEVLLRYGRDLLNSRARRMWAVYLELLVSVAWSYVIALVFLLWAIGQVFTLPAGLQIETILPGWSGLLLGMTCLLQFAISLIIDSRYERNVGKYYFWVIWYPMAFWMLTALTTVVALPRAMIRRRGRAVWESPDRGINAEAPMRSK
ncbi:MAG: poly-beta-1,6-N-acetyl-D-glucosamine synthase [Pseudomonadota bacterium]